MHFKMEGTLKDDSKEEVTSSQQTNKEEIQLNQNSLPSSASFETLNENNFEQWLDSNKITSFSKEKIQKAWEHLEKNLGDFIKKSDIEDNFLVEAENIIPYKIRQALKKWAGLAPQQATSQQQDLSEKVNNLVDQFANLSSSIYAFMNKSSESQAFFKQTLLNYYQMENAKCIFTGVENPTAAHLIPKSSMLEEDARQLLENVLKNNLHSPLNGLFLADYLERTLDLALWIPILDGTHLRIKVAKDLDLIPSDQKIVVPLCSSQNNPVPSHLISKLKNTLKDYPISIDLGNKLPAPEVLKWLERRFEFYLKKRNLLRPEKQWVPKNTNQN